MYLFSTPNGPSIPVFGRCPKKIAPDADFAVTYARRAKVLVEQTLLPVSKAMALSVPEII